jgi:type II secretory pathway pseudopilin PulG
MKTCRQDRGFKLIELIFTTAVVGIAGLIVYSILQMGTVLGAKNAAVNTAHQQARTAMLQMVQDLHTAVSLPSLCDSTSGRNCLSVMVWRALQNRRKCEYWRHPGYRDFAEYHLAGSSRRPAPDYPWTPD